MKNNDYCGWSMFDNVTIVAKPVLHHDWTNDTVTVQDKFQGFVVDSTNTKQLETAKRWAEQIIYGPYDEKTRDYPEKRVIEGTEHTYKNDGFTLELSEAAESSSQGGKLSFWNCWITAPDGERFLIGIAANLLLDVLKNTTVINGVVQEPLMFARCKGGVGMISRNMEAYKQAQADMAHKAKVSKGKTSKHKVGHVYETIREKNIYFGKIYQHYEPVYVEEPRGWTTRQKLIGFKRRETPLELHVFPDYESGKNKLSDYTSPDRRYMWWRLTQKKLPARVESDIVVELDVGLEAVVDRINQQELFHDAQAAKTAAEKGYTTFTYTDPLKVGLSASAEHFEFSEAEKDALKSLDLRIMD